MKRVRITSDSLNSYGTRVLTDGMDTGQYEKNPVLLYMHQRGTVIGYLKDIKKEDDGITAEPVFDCASELSVQCKKQWEFGSLKMVSVGIDILEMSEDPELLVQGQTSPTITKSKLFEVSVVDIGSNDDAIVLKKDGKQITLGQGGGSSLPLLNKQQNLKTEEMNVKELALSLGLPETADEAAVNSKLKELQAAQAEVEKLRSEKASLELANITSVVEAAIAEKKISAEKKEHFINLGKMAGIDSLKETFAAIAPQVKLSQALNMGNDNASQTTATYSKLSEVPSEELKRMRSENPVEYKRLYKAEYGVECEM